MSIRLYDLVGTVDLNTKKFRTAMKEVNKDFEENEKQIAKAEKAYGDLEKKIVTASEKIAKAEMDREEAVVEVLEKTIKKREELNEKISQAEKDRVEKLKSNQLAEEQAREKALRDGIRAEENYQKKLDELLGRKDSKLLARRFDLQKKASDPEFYRAEFNKRRESNQNQVFNILQGIGEGRLDQNDGKVQQRLRLLNGQLNKSFEEFAANKIKSATKKLAEFDAGFSSAQNPKIDAQIENLDRQFRQGIQKRKESLTATLQRLQLSGPQALEGIDRNIAGLLEQQKELTSTTNQAIEKVTSGFTKIIAQNKQIVADAIKTQNAVTMQFAQAGGNKLRGGILPFDISAQSRTNSRTSALQSSANTRIDQLNVKTFNDLQDIFMQGVTTGSIEEENKKILAAKKTLADLAEQNVKIERQLVTDQIRSRAEFDRIRQQQQQQDMNDKRSRYASQIAGAGFALYGATQFARGGAQDAQDIIGELNNTTIAFNDRAKATDRINEKSVETGRSVKELAVAFREIENVLGSGKVGLDAWNQSTKAAIATNSQIGSVARATAGVMKLYPNEFKNATEAINILSLAARKSPLEFEDFSTVMGSVVGISKQVGLTATEATAALSLFSEEQLRSAEAGTQLRNVVNKLVNPVEKVVKQISKDSRVDLGFAFSKAGVDALGFTGVLAKVDEAAKKLNVSSGELARKLFPNLRGTVGGTILVEKLDEYLKLVGELNGARRDSTFIEQSYAIAMNTTNTRLQQAEQASRQLSQELSVAMLPAMNVVLGATKGLNTVLGSLPDGIKSVGVSASAAGAGALIFGRGVQLAWTFVQNLHPALKIAGVAITALTAGYSLFTINQKGATKQEKELEDAMKNVNRESYKRLDSIAGHEKSLDRLFGKQKLSLGQEAEKINMVEDIFKATGVEIKVTDDLTTAHKKLADAIDIANSKKREQEQLYTRDKILEGSKEVNALLVRRNKQQEITRTEGQRLADLQRIPNNDYAVQQQAKNLDREVKKLEQYTREYEIAYRQFDVKNRMLLSQMRSGVLPGFNDPVKPLDPLKTGKDEADKAREKQLSRTLSQRKSNVDSLYREWVNIEERLYKIKNGDSFSSEANFKKFIMEAGFTKQVDALDLMSDEGAMGASAKLAEALLASFVTQSAKLDQALIEQKRVKDRLEFSVKQENALNDLYLALGNKTKDLTFVDDSKFTELEKAQKFLREVQEIFGKPNFEALAGTKRGQELMSNYRSAAMSADIRKEFAQEAEDIAKQQKDAWKQFTDGLENAYGRIRSVRAKINDILTPASNRQSILNELTSGEFKDLSEIKDAGLLDYLTKAVDKIEEFRLAQEAGKSKSVFDGVAEKITKIRGEIGRITGGDYEDFLNSLGFDSEQVRKNDFLGLGDQMLQELYRLQKSKDAIEDVYKKLKAIRQRETGGTGIPEIDAVNAELGRRDRRLSYIDDLERNFKRGIATGVRGGLKSGLQDMRRNIEDALITNASDAIGKLIFDGVKSTGILDQIFGSTKISDKTQNAINNPEAFANALGRQILNVRVINQNGGATPTISMTNTSGASQAPFKQDASIYGPVQYPGQNSAPAQSRSAKYGVGDYAGTYAKYQYGGTGGKVSALGDVAKYAGLKNIAKFAGKLSPYLLANDLLGDPLGRAGRWLSGSLFGSKKKSNNGASRSIEVNLPNATITSPTDAAYVASELSRNLRNSPQLARG